MEWLAERIRGRRHESDPALIELVERSHAEGALDREVAARAHKVADLWNERIAESWRTRRPDV